MVFEVVKKVVDGNERPEIKKAMPKFWVEVMEKCWVRDYKDRPDMADIARELEEWYVRTLDM